MPSLQERVFVPRPIHFNIREGTECQAAPGTSCAYYMDRVISSRKDQLQEHVMLNDMYEGMADRIQFKTDGVDTVPIDSQKVYTLEDKQGLQPRGAFMGKETLQKRGIDIGDLAFRIGVLHGLVYAADLNPKDVEIVLTHDDKVAMFDFGMVSEPFDVDTELNYNMYVPDPDDALREDYVAGVKFITKGQYKAFGGRKRASVG
ncbi:hypothetical protein JKP88DRAFT_179722 [Tribonema minus]|uniref:Uncharacterized protein n=1 Tax=Tribonema minus TaxID=303371 RepID=A0A835Z2G6_9STRA|nr:hypothetical protein JKP88DRAFT_179722 [Tribonema minus]